MSPTATRVDLDALVSMVKGARIVSFHDIPAAAQELLKMELLATCQNAAPSGRNVMILSGHNGGGLRIVEWWYEMIEGMNDGQYQVLRPCDEQRLKYLEAVRTKLGELEESKALEALGVGREEETEGIPTLDPLKSLTT